MACSKPIKISINNKENFSFHYAFNQFTTFNDLLEFIAYNYPEVDLCPCFRFKINNENEISNDTKVIDYIVKYSAFQLIDNDPERKCVYNTLYKDYLKKSKLEIFQKYIQKEKTEIEKEIEKLNEKIKSLENEIESYKNKNKALQEEMEKIEQKNKLLELAINGDPDTIEKLKNLGAIDQNFAPKENSNLKIDPNTNEIIGGKKPILEPNFVNFYDVVIDIKSVKDIYKGWEIKRSERAEKNYEDFKKEKIIKIGVIGNSNKGKSFLLSKISKIELPSGTSIRTEGISIKYPELDLFKDRKIVLLDSAGLETPVLKEEEDKKTEGEEKGQEKEEKKEDENEDENEKTNEKELFKEKSREKLITELFLQNYIIVNSDILLVVVGILTYSEQKLINRIKTEIQRSKLNKTLFIVHNLITYTTIEQVKDYAKHYLYKSATFHLEEGQKISTKLKEKKGGFFYEKNTDPKIYHLIFANEGSEAGNYYNPFTLDFIESEFQRVTDIKNFDVIKTVKERFIEKSTDFMEKLEKPLKLTDFDDSNNKLIKLNNNNNNNVALKKCLIDELGFSNLKSNGFEPTYNYYKKGDKIIIRLEAPGNTSIKSSVDALGEYKIIRLTGNKKKDKEPEKLEDNVFNSRESGPFSLDIPLKNEDFMIKNEAPTYAEKKGVIILEFKLEEKEIDKGYTPNDEDDI